jgi:hypothetical protein
MSRWPLAWPFTYCRCKSTTAFLQCPWWSSRLWRGVYMYRQTYCLSLLGFSVGTQQVHMALHPRRPPTTSSPPERPQNSAYFHFKLLEWTQAERSSCTFINERNLLRKTLFLSDTPFRFGSYGTGVWDPRISQWITPNFGFVIESGEGKSENVRRSTTANSLSKYSITEYIFPLLILTR